MTDKIKLARKDAVSAFWPDCENDYIRIKRYMVAKSLFVAALLILNIVLALIFFLVWGSAPVTMADGIPAYRHYSMRLRGFTGVATILDKNKNPVYTGNLVKGKATGYGELKDREGNPVYAGDFFENRYNGEGEMYYPDGAVKYRGQFKNNLFDGTGELYYPSGIKFYVGGFLSGKKQGEGELSDDSGGTIYSGVFVDDGIFFKGYIGGESKSLGDFSGERAVYDGEYDTSVALRDFGVIYVLNRTEDGDTGAKITRMYDVSGMAAKSREPYTAQELREVFGVPFYAGYGDILAPDMAAAEELKRLGELPQDSALSYEMSPVAGGIYEVGYEPGQKLYLESYRDDEWFYTYYFTQKDRPYLFYSVERAGSVWQRTLQIF